MDRLQENIIALAKAGHPWLATIKALAGRTDAVYADSGQFDAITWVATGDRQYLDDAVPKLLKLLTIEPLPVPNNVREYFAEMAMLYRWLRPDLSEEQNEEFEKRLHRWCEFACGVNMPAKYTGGWGTYTDSDLTTGQYLGLLICDQTFGWTWTERPDVKKAREAIKQFVAKSAGGEWLESGAYNLGTLQFLLMGCYAAGIENFPEVEKLVPDIVEQQLTNLTPDFKAAYQWGDEENPREMHVHRRVALFGILHGLTGDPRLILAMDAILAGKTFKDYANLAWRLIYFTRAPKPIPTVQYLRVSEGNGHFIYKRDNAMLCVHFPKRLGVQHEVGYTTDIQLYLDGEWVLTRPIGYGLAAVSGNSGNSPLFAGLSAMQSRGPTQWIETPNQCTIVGGTQGGYYESGYYQPPPPFLTQYMRQITYLFPRKITVSDTFNGNTPSRLDRYRPADQAIIKMAPLWQQVWHCPVEPTKTETGFTWKTAGGKTIVLTAPKDCKSSVVDEKVLWAAAKTNFKPSELKWQILFSRETPQCVMTTTIEVS